MDTAYHRVLRALIAFFAAAIILAVFPYSPLPTWDIKVLLLRLFGFAALAFLLFGARDSRTPVTGLGRWMAACCALVVALSFVSALWAANPGHALLEALTLGSCALLFLGARYAYRSAGQLVPLFVTLCAAAALASVYGLLRYLGYQVFPWPELSQPTAGATATFGNPNVASHTIILAIILAGGVAAMRHSLWPLILAAPSALLLAAAQTRGSLLGLGAALLLAAAAVIIRRGAARPAAGVALTLAAASLAVGAGFFAASEAYSSRTGLAVPSGSTLTLRYHSFSGAAQMIVEGPALGRGPGSYVIESPAYWSRLEKERFSAENRISARVHNEPLELAVTIGLPGAAAYLLFLLSGMVLGLWQFFSGADRNARWAGLAGASFLTAFLVDGLFGFNLQSPASGGLLFIVAGAMAGLDRRIPEGDAPPVRRRALSLSTVGLLTGSILPIAAALQFASLCYQQRGIAALSQDAPVAARESLDTAAALNPFDWNNPNYLARVHEAEGRLDEAIAEYGRSLRLHPNFIPAMLGLARTHFNRSDRLEGEAAAEALEEAIAAAEQAGTFYTNLPEVYDLLGRAAIKQARAAGGDSGSDYWVRAEEHLVRAIELGLRYAAQGHRLVFEARYARGDVLGAEQALVNAYLADPKAEETWDVFRQAASATGRYGALEACLAREAAYLAAVDLPIYTEHFARILIWLAWTNEEGYSDTAGAREALIRAVEEAPGFAPAWDAHWRFSEEHGGSEDFLEALLRLAPRIDSRDAPAAEELRIAVEAAALEPGELERQSEAVARMASAADGGQKEKLRWCGEFLLHLLHRGGPPTAEESVAGYFLGIFFGAVEDFERVEVALAPAEPFLRGERLGDSLERRGVALTQLGRTGEAVETLARALRERPNQFSTHFAYAQALAANGQSEKARLNLIDLRENAADPEARRRIEAELNALP